MDSVFGIGAPELIAILLLAGIVMGPQRIRQVALWLGKTTAYLQSISRGFVRQLNAELDAVDGGGELRDTMNEVKDLRRQIQDLRREITTGAISPIRESQEILQESRDLIEHSIAPPSLKSSNNQAARDEENKVEIGDDPTPPSLPNLLPVPDDPEI